MTTNMEKGIYNAGDIIDNAFVIKKYLNKGTYGKIFIVTKKNSDEQLALKLETDLELPGEGGLRVEVEFLRTLNASTNHVPRFIANGVAGKLQYMVLQLLGKDLGKMLEKNDFQFSLSTAIRLGQQTLDCLEAVHRQGIVHRDVKPGNFGLGRSQQDCNKVYVFDFGLAKRFRLENGTIIPERTSPKFAGTSRYASLNIHRGKEASPPDDLCSWVYMVVEFFKQLAWHESKTREEMAELKKKTDEIFSGIEPQIKAIMQSAQSLQYGEMPLYDLYKHKIAEIKTKHSVNDQDPYDWEKPKIPSAQLQLAPGQKKEAAKQASTVSQ